MKYIDADLLRKEIEFEKTVYDNPNRVVHGVADAFRQDGRAVMCDDILNLIDSLQQEQQEEPDKSLDEEIRRYYREECSSDDEPTTEETARHFAEWQKEQFEKNRLAHCDALSKEDYDRETDFAMEIIEKEHRQPTFIDAINYGIRLQKEQMLKDAVDADVNIYKDLVAGKSWAEFVVEMPTNNLGDKVKLIVVKEDKK